MKVLIIGGTGILGKTFLRLMNPDSYQITVLTRNPSSLEQSDPRVRVLSGNVLDRSTMMAVGRSMDAVLNFTSAVPKKLKTTAEDWLENDELRTAGIRNVLDAIGDSDCFYCQSGMSLVYGDHGGDPVDETSEIRPSVLTKSTESMEQLFLNASAKSLRGVSFRFSAFYHQDAWHTRAMVHELSNRRLPIIGDGEYYWNLIHVEDAARAVLKVLESQHKVSGREIMNVSDDEPVKSKDFLITLAHLLSVPEPIKMPLFIARMALGADAIEVLTASHRCVTSRIRSFDWAPQFPTYREGFSSIVKVLEPN